MGKARYADKNPFVPVEVEDEKEPPKPKRKRKAKKSSRAIDDLAARIAALETVTDPSPVDSSTERILVPVRRRRR